jgi:hypothetical protein
MNNMSEKEIIKKINDLKKEVNNPEQDYAPLKAQEMLDEIVELEDMLESIRHEKLKITPVINAPTVADRPKGRRNRRMVDSRIIL